MQHGERDISGLLHAWHGGDQGALDVLIPLVEPELRKIARHHLAHLRPDLTLTATSLVQELFVQLTRKSRVGWRDRAQFSGLCAKIMRDIVVDHARSHLCAKRGGGAQSVPLSNAEAISNDGSAELIVIHQALDKLTEIDDRKGRVVEMRFFGGLSVEETAEALGISRETVMRDWRIARMWLLRYIEGNPADAARMATD